MRAMPAASVDAVVCDPPYGLEFMGKEWDGSDGFRRSLNEADVGRKNTFGRISARSPEYRAGTLFQEWCEAWCAEALRVLKPGGYLLAFGGTRTYHRIAVAIEDAGFEVRDSLIWNYGCLSEDSEALTRRGWVRGPALRADDDVLQWDAATGVFAWARPSRITVAPYVGPLVRLANRNTDQLLTPNHRVYARVQRHPRHAPATEYEVLDADTVGNRSTAWRVTLPCAGTLTEGEHVDPDYAYLVGWWLTDAWAHREGKACMFSQSKRDTLPKLRAALAPYAPSEYVKSGKKDAHADEHTFYLTGPIADRLLTEHPERRLTWDMLGWDLPARHALYRGLMDGDGSQPGAQYAHTFWSKNADRRDVFLALATTLGFRSFIGNKDCVFVNTETATTEVQGKHRVAPVDYEGLVWCVTVPTGAFLARRNGRPFVTGNSGFPKSLNVAIAIDKAAGAMGHRGKGVTVAGYTPGRDLEVAKGMPAHEPITDAAKAWSGWGTALKPAFEPVVVARRPVEGTVAANVLKHGTGALNIDGCRVKCEPGDKGEWPITPRTAERGSMAGPMSPVTTDQTVGRWPANVLFTHAPGCVRVGERTVGRGDIVPGDAVQRTSTMLPEGAGWNKNSLDNSKKNAPNSYGTETVAAYECAPGCPVAALDAQSGDTGGASRFFTIADYGPDDDLPGAQPGDPPFLYCTKASRSEREAGCEGLPPKSAVEAVGRDPESVGAKSPRAGAGRGAGASKPICAECGIDLSGGSRPASRCAVSADGAHVAVNRGDEKGALIHNHHPTVKPVAVMRWLCRLSVPPGGVVLDPFMGSGTTGIAAIREGFRFIGCEREPDYLAIARARIAHAGVADIVTRELPADAAALSPVSPVAMMSVPPTTRKEATIVYVKSIESNVKKGVKAELGRLTLIVGPNGSGKSTIVNGVELALSGRASDVVGRAEVAKGIDLLALAPAGDDALWSRAALSDGRSAEWRCERNAKTGGAREATHAIPADVKPSFPVRAVREALAGSPATVRAWLVGRIGSGVSEAAVLGLIPEDLHGAYAELCRPLFGFPAEVLLDAREAAAKQARNAGADAKAANALADQTGASIDPEPTDDEIEAARQRVRDAAVAASAPIKARVTYDLPRMRATAEARVADYAALDAEAQRLRADIGDAPAPNADVVRLRDALTRVMVFTAQKNAADCLICGSAVPHGAHAAMLTRAEALTNAARNDVAVIEGRERLARVEAVLPEAQRIAQDAVMAFRNASDAASTVAAVDTEAPGRLHAAEEAVRRLESARAAWANVRAAKARARDLTARQRLYGDLHAAIEDAIGGVLERARRDFIGRVQSYLPPGDVFDLVLEDGGKDVCRFGFVRDGALHTALSGAEWARLTLALAAAVTSDDEANLSVLTPEDRAFDADTLRAVMVGLTNAPGQVLLCSPVAPTGRTPKGWTVIDLSPKAAKAPKAAKGEDDPMPFDAVGEAK